MSSDSDIEIDGNIFEEPEGYLPPPPEPTFETYTRDSKYVKDGQPANVRMRLVGKSPLWGHLLWNAGKVTADYMDLKRDEWITGKTVLELGAAAALPSLLASLTADNVVITDYPDPDLIDNINENVKLLRESVPNGAKLPITVEGYIWGNPVDDLLNAKNQNGRKFDLIILSDLIFNHSEHEKLIRTCDKCLAPDGKLFVVFTHHRPKLADKDLAFFPTAKEQAGFKSERIIEKKMTPMFEEEEETAHIRSMVYGYVVTR
ncbi:Nnt1p [Sugiyamaella lignohabitans]|uniref:Protein N-terminal and lysine N-methyltransferase EFM7 n=1 Tax=Sugiyamaella lignohabitans TaxID=796027 RepID=A0A167F8L1_9ASCO|nr:Nnt1p [Sugiyamaella lignohabitans]ANB14962.1 Nnt1p [Sugiyamaella lignohabitans]